MIRWYAVFTQPHGETKAVQHLSRQGYLVYLPRYRARVSHARRCQTVLRPLFPRYLFAGIDRASMRWRPILSTLGVADVVRAGDEPATVPSKIVATIRAREEAGDFDRFNPQHSLRLGEFVRVTAGAFEDMVGTLVELREKDRIVVLLEWLGRSVRAQLAAEAVEAA
jgi:transcriptional antiterminator RfaH